jgi:hypothetical protein
VASRTHDDPPAPASPGRGRLSSSS